MIKRAESGFGALRTVLDDQLPPVLGRVDAYFDELIPVIDTIDRYKREVTAFLGNVSAAPNGASIPARPAEAGQVPARHRPARPGRPRLAAVARTRPPGSTPT